MPDDSPTSRSVDASAAPQLIDTCLRSGIDHFFLAPGSRCTPLTLAIADHDEAHVVQHFDERALAFACLGYARATGRPGVFVCTSGTAVANAFPAVVEAAQDHVPVILLTADRPPELRACGANQTIDQVKIFAGYTRWSFDVPCWDARIENRFWSATMRHALDRAQEGPVQLNCMFREPFATRGECRPVTKLPVAELPVAELPVAESPIETVTRCEWQVPSGQTLVIAGGCRRDEALAAARLAERIGCPFLADVSTSVRGLSYDLQLMRDDNPPADVIVHVGQRIVSKRWLQFVAAHPPRHYIQLTANRARVDPMHRGTQILHGPLVSLCDGAVAPADTRTPFLDAWSTRSEASMNAAEEILSTQSEITEPGIALTIAAEIPDDRGLLLGNSMPIRDMDMVGRWGSDRRICVAANRGASGIDGLIATSVGFACGLQRPTTALIGDLAALHDLNSLSLLANSPTPVVLVVINNDGGGIFHFLPVATESNHFERFFATPHGRQFADVAHMFGIAYHCPTSISEFKVTYRKAMSESRSSLIEVRTDRHQNRELHARIEAAVREACV